MKQVLVIHYSQTGQLSSLAKSIAAPLERDPAINVTYANLEPQIAHPFPWPFLQFFDAFPECIYEDAKPNKPLAIAQNAELDLIILAYQVWFLAPSLPVTAFLQSADAKRIFSNKPVVTVIACRDMWMMAQERVKLRLQNLGAKHIDNVVLTDAAGSALSFFSTPLWMLTGHKGPFAFGIPKAGVHPDEIAAASRFGDAIVKGLQQGTLDKPLLTGLGAVTIRHRLIASEKVGQRSFKAWGALIRLLGKPGAISRKFGLLFYIVFLVAIIITVIPITTVIKRLCAPLMKKRIQQQIDYFAAPSGDARDRIQ